MMALSSTHKKRRLSSFSTSPPDGVPPDSLTPGSAARNAAVEVALLATPTKHRASSTDREGPKEGSAAAAADGESAEQPASGCVARLEKKDRQQIHKP